MEPSTVPADKDDKEQSAHKSGWRDATIKLGGYSQIIGDTAMLTYGLTTKKFGFGVLGGLGYAAGVVGSFFGNPKAEKQLAQVERDLGNYLRKQGIEIPKDPTLEKLSKPGGVLDGVASFLYAYPTQLINTCFGLMGVALYHEGHKKNVLVKTQNLDPKKENGNALLASGALMVISGLYGILQKEKKPDPEHPPQGMWEKAKSWVQERPLVVSGMLANGNQAFLLKNWWDEYKTNKTSPVKSNAHVFNLLAIASWTLCNIMLMMSSKGEGGGAHLDEKNRNQLADVSARVIAAQPREVQDKLIEHVSGFLASEPYVNMKAQDISTLLRGKIDAVQDVAAGKHWQNHVGPAADAGRSVS